MTEDQAKTKWCPERAKATGARGRYQFGPDTMCVTSDCMMWAEDKDTIIGYEDSGKPIIKKAENGGYCGLSRQ